MVLLGDVAFMVQRAHWKKTHKHMLVEHTKCSDMHHNIEEDAREIAELHQMSLEDWNVTRSEWNKGERAEPRKQLQNRYGVFQNWKSIKIFVSSTFRDMHGERDMINAVVIPQINDILKEYKIQLHAIDLRWGLTAEDTSTSGLGALEHCLREVQKSTPFFISLLGERYGWCPEEYKISNRPEFKWIKTQPPGYSITHLEVLQGVLKSWGKPIHGFSYERQANFIDSMQDEKAKNIFEFDYKNDPTNAKLQLRNQMRAELKSHPYNLYHSYHCKYVGRDSHGRAAVGALGGLAEQMITDITSAIIFEYHLIDIRKASLIQFNSKKAQQQRRSSMMLWPGANQTELNPIAKSIHEIHIEKIRLRHEEQVKFLTREARLHDNYSSHFAADFVPRPAERDAIFSKILECDPQHDSSDQGLEQHVGVKNALRAVAVLGRQGSGKTSLLSEISKSLKSNAHPRAHVFSHFCGASPSSGDMKMLLHRLGCAVAREFNVDKQGVSNINIFLALSSNNCRIWLEEILHEAAKEAIKVGHYIVIIIDGADQMDDKDEALSLRWLPVYTSLGCRIVISASVYRNSDATKQNARGEKEESKEQQAEQTGEQQEPLDFGQEHRQRIIEAAFASRDPPLPVVAVEELVDDQSLRVVDSLLRQHSKRLTEDQLHLLLKKKDHNSCLYLWATLEELRLCGDYGLDGQVINQMIANFPSTLEPLFDQILNRIEINVEKFCGEHHDTAVKTRLITGEHHHAQSDHPEEISGRSVVQHVLSLLACSRNGLYEHDLLQMSCPKDWPHGNSLPTVIWSRIYHAIECYCRTRTTHDHGIISFSQRGFARAVRQRYMSRKETKPMMRKIYKQLADFMLDYSGAKNYQHWSPVFKENNTLAQRHFVTAFADTTYYQILAFDFESLRDTTLGNLKYIEMASRLSNTEDNGNLLVHLIHDYRVALNVIQTAPLEEIKPHLERASTTRREVLWWLKSMNDFVTQQQHNLIRAPLLTLQLALQELDDTAVHVWAKEIILTEQLNNMNKNKKQSSSMSASLPSTSIQQLLYCRWVNKPSLRLLRASLGPLSAGGMCCADLGNGLEVMGLENGDVVVMKRTSEEIVAAVRSSSFINSSYGHCASVYSISTCNGYFVTTSMDCQVIVWDAQKFVPLAHGGKPILLTYDDVLVLDNNENNTQANKKKVDFNNPSGNDGDLSPRRTSVVADSADGHTEVVTCSAVLLPDNASAHIQSTLGSFYFVTGSLDRTSRLWYYERYLATDLPDDGSTAAHGNLVSRCQINMMSGILCAAIHTDCSAVAMGTDHGHVQLIDCTKVQSERKITVHKSWKAHRTSISSLSYCNIDDGGKFVLATGGLDATVKIWSSVDCSLSSSTVKMSKKSPIPLRILYSSLGGISIVKWSPVIGAENRGVRYLVAGTLKEEILVWSVDQVTLKPIRVSSFEGHADVVNDLHFTVETKTDGAADASSSGTSKYSMVSLSRDRHLHVWDLINMSDKNESGVNRESGADNVAKETSRLTKMNGGQAHEEAVTACTMSASGNVAITGDRGGKVITWNARTGVPISELYAEFFAEKSGSTNGTKHGTTHGSEITSLSTDFNGNTIVAGSSNGRVFLWQRQSTNSSNNSKKTPLQHFERKKTNYHIISSVATRTYSLQISQANVHQMSISCVLVIQPPTGAGDVVTVVTGDLSGEMKVWKAKTGLRTSAKSISTVPGKKLLLKQNFQHDAGIQQLTYKQANRRPTPSCHASMSLLAVNILDNGVALYDITSWTLIKTFVPKNTISARRGTSTFSPDSCEFGFFDWDAGADTVADQPMEALEETGAYVTSTHEALQTSVKRARRASLRRATEYDGKPPSRLQVWYVDPVQSKEKQQGSEEQEAKTSLPDDPIWSTSASHPHDRLLGDKMDSKVKFACTTGGGRFLLGAFEDATVRGFDTLLKGQRCCSYMFPDQITCMAAAQKTGTATMVCGDMHGRVFIVDLGLDLDLTWNASRLNNANEEEDNEEDDKRRRPPVSFSRHRKESTAMSAIRLDRARNNCNHIRNIPPSVYCARKTVKVGTVERHSHAIAAYALNSEGGAQTGCGALEVLAQLGLSNYSCGLQIMGTLGASSVRSQKFALPQIQTALEFGLFPAAMETKALVMDFGVSSTLTSMVGKSFRKVKQISEGNQKDSDKDEVCRLIGIAPLVSTTITKEHIKNVDSGELLEWPASLERGHDHFVLLEYTREESEDLEFLLNVHKEMQCNKIPSTVVLVNGGDEEKVMLVHLVRMGVPIVVLEGTGGLADEIASLRGVLKQSKWHLVRSTVNKKKSRVQKLVSLLRLNDEVTKFICTYAKLHVVSMNAAEKLKPLLLRLLRPKVSR